MTVATKEKSGTSTKPEPSHQASKAESLASLVDITSVAVIYPPPGETTKLIYGEPKVGKTKFCDAMPGAFFFATEPGHDFCKSSKKRARSWGPNDKAVTSDPEAVDFQTFVRALYDAKKQGKLKVRTVVVDIVDNLYAMCLNHVCGKKGLEYPPENDFGKTWKEVREEWEKWIRALLDVVPVTFVTHTTTDKVEVMGANKVRKEIERRVPTFKGNKAAQFLDGVINLIGFAHFGPGGERQITFQGDQSLATGDRTGIFEGMGPLPLDWAKVAKAYEDECKRRKIEIRSKWS